MSAQFVMPKIRERIGLRFGKNKTEELCRLIYEIGKRESRDSEHILAEILAERNVQFEEAPFSKIKHVLLKKRFPKLSDADLERVYLAPLNVSSEKENISEARPKFEPFKPTEIYIERKALKFPLTGRVLAAWPDIPNFKIDSFSYITFKPAKFSIQRIIVGVLKQF